MYNKSTMKLPEKKEKITYMDYAATSPMPKEVVKAMEPFWSVNFGNPSSIHFVGREARYVLDECRQKIASILDCQENEIYFTSGGTENDNLAIFGIARNNKFQMTNNKQIPNFQMSKRKHIITTMIEHQAVLKVFKILENEGFEVTYLPVSKDGVVNPQDVVEALRPNTVLVSVIYVSNEIGTVQPIKQIGKLIKEQNEKRKLDPANVWGKIYFHSDAVQAPEYFSLNTKRQFVDLLSLSAHKFGGPKGVGVLYVKKEVPIVPLVVGGEQELALRPGTENVAGIVGMTKALEMATQKRYDGRDKTVMDIKNYFEQKIMNEVGEVKIIGQNVQRSPGITAVIFGGVDPVAVVMNLDLAGICVSSGAACSSGSIEKSHVIEALGLEPPFDQGAVRFCFSEILSKEDIDRAVVKLKEIIEKLRKS